MEAKLFPGSPYSLAKNGVLTVAPQYLLSFHETARDKFKTISRQIEDKLKMVAMEDNLKTVAIVLREPVVRTRR